MSIFRGNHQRAQGLGGLANNSVRKRGERRAPVTLLNCWDSQAAPRLLSTGRQTWSPRETHATTQVDFCSSPGPRSPKVSQGVLSCLQTCFPRKRGGTRLPATQPREVEQHGQLEQSIRGSGKARKYQLSHLHSCETRSCRVMPKAFGT